VKENPSHRSFEEAFLYFRDLVLWRGKGMPKIRFPGDFFFFEQHANAYNISWRFQSQAS
jgi:hypothetical protein